MKREKWIDYTKAFACVLVVLGHLLQGLNKAHIAWNQEFYQYIDTFIYIFHMPLFMCISGYLYKKTVKINTIKEYISFVKKKLINLGIPYVLFYLLHIGINMIFAKSVNNPMGVQEILRIFTQPIAPFWFLYALFFIFLLIPLVEKVAKGNSKKVFLFLGILHIIAIFFKFNIYAIDIVMQFAVYFYLGALLYKKGIKEYSNIQYTITIVGYSILAVFYCYLEINSSISTIYLQIIKMILAILGTYVSLIIFKKIENKLENNLVYNAISKYNFQIYLLHTIFIAGTRIVLIKVFISNFYIQLILGLVAGILGPIIFAKIVEKFKYVNIIFFPTSTIKNLKEVEK